MYKVLIKKYIRDLQNSKQTGFNTDKINSLGIVINTDEISDFNLFDNLTKQIGIKPNKIKIIAFSSTMHKNTVSWDSCYYPKDFTWNGRAKNAELRAFINTSFDALISFYNKDELPLKVITAGSKARFKIGIQEKDDGLNDFIINTPVGEYGLFETELIKYLKTFNKLNNE